MFRYLGYFCTFMEYYHEVLFREMAKLYGCDILL